MSPTSTQPTLDTLRDLVLADYHANGFKTVWRVERSLARLQEFFGNHHTITSSDVAAYIAKRLKTNKPATVNRDLETLKKGFRLASRYGLDVPIPHVPKLRENNVRSGFVTQEELRRIVENLPAYLRPIIQAAAITGWRIGELKSRQWRHVDREAGYLRLEPSESKNGRARSFPLIQPLLDVLPPQTCEWVFNRNGKPVGDFRKAWRTATTRAGCQGVWVHDLRRRGVDPVFWTKTGRS